ncbi:hypothetical protein SS7213T_02488, partial [Staphylococcus simiae CCM 7213 = CCUG 51256]
HALDAAKQAFQPMLEGLVKYLLNDVEHRPFLLVL